MECNHRNNNICMISSNIAGKTCYVNESVCIACIKEKNPQSENKVTISLAIRNSDNNHANYLLNNWSEVLFDNSKLKNILDDDGVGSQLWRMLEELGIKHNSNCECLSWAERMNKWGPQGCREQFKEITEHLKKSALSYGWINLSKTIINSSFSNLSFHLDPLHPFQSLLNEAISRAEKAISIKNKTNTNIGNELANKLNWSMDSEEILTTIDKINFCDPKIDIDKIVDYAIKGQCITLSSYNIDSSWKTSIRSIVKSYLNKDISIKQISNNNIESDAIDILLPLGPGSVFNNIELKYAIRSIEYYATGWNRIYVVGTIPSWLEESERIKPVFKKEYNHNKATRISRKVLWSFENLPLTENIAFWNDDYFLINPIDVRTIPPYYRGILKRDPTRGGWYKTLNVTSEALLEAGLQNRHYDIHVPIILNRDKFCSLGDWWRRSRNVPGMGYVMKSIYGNNFCENESISTKDCKFQNGWSSKKINNMRNNGRWVISYGDGALKSGLDIWMSEQFT